MKSETTLAPLQGFVLNCDFEEFSRKAHLVPVIAARGKTGMAQTGAMRWMCRDNYEEPDSLGSLRQMINHCKTAHEVAMGRKMDEDEAKLWIADSIANFLDPEKVSLDGLYYTIGPDNHTLIIYRDDVGRLVGIPRETIIGLIWTIENGAAATAPEN